MFCWRAEFPEKWCCEMPKCRLGWSSCLSTSCENNIGKRCIKITSVMSSWAALRRLVHLLASLNCLQNQLWLHAHCDSIGSFSSRLLLVPEVHCNSTVLKRPKAASRVTFTLAERFQYACRSVHRSNQWATFIVDSAEIDKKKDAHTHHSASSAHSACLV